VLRGEDVTIARDRAGGAGGIASGWTEPRSGRRYGPAIARQYPGSEFYLETGLENSRFR
jgi:hypothetical protein